MKGPDVRVDARPGIALTARELAVLKGFADGLSNAEIGLALFITEDTVKTHARRLFAKLNARDRAHAVALGYRGRILRPAWPLPIPLAVLRLTTGQQFVPPPPPPPPPPRSFRDPRIAAVMRVLGGWRSVRQHHLPAQTFARFYDMVAAALNPNGAPRP